MTFWPNGLASRTLLITTLGLLGLFPALGLAQQLDTGTQPQQAKGAHPRVIERYIPPGFQRKAMDYTEAPVSSESAGAYYSPSTSGMNSHTQSAPIPNVSMGKALTASVTHTLYLPPAMYGEWNVIGTLIESNDPDFFTPNVSDIWLLEREGDQVTVTNPVNGANAAINVDKAEGNQATFHRSGTAGRHAIYQEIPTITVHGDTFSGQSLNKLQNIKDGQVVREIYGIYRLEATRISTARARFRPETEQQDPDLEIEEVQH